MSRPVMPLLLMLTMTIAMMNAAAVERKTTDSVHGAIQQRQGLASDHGRSR